MHISSGGALKAADLHLYPVIGGRSGAQRHGHATAGAHVPRHGQAEYPRDAQGKLLTPAMIILNADIHIIPAAHHHLRALEIPRQGHGHDGHARPVGRTIRRGGFSALG